MRNSPLLSLIFARYDKHGKLNICRHCVHFTQNYHGDYHTVAENGCKKYSHQNLITGKIVYKALPGCRESPEMCSIEGKDFEQAKYANLRNLKLKVYAHFWNYRSVYGMVVFFGGMTVILKSFLDADLKHRERK